MPNTATTTTDNPRLGPRQTLRLRDPAALLRRVARRTPLRPQRLIGVVLSVGRQYVVDAVDLPSENVAQSPAHRRLVAAIGSAVPPNAARTHALLFVHCRVGRVVWLPGDLEWSELGNRLARTHGLRTADHVLLTEHGWRTRPGDSAGTTPALVLR